MQDPSYGVAHQLQSHLHLISGHRFPLLPQLTIEQAYRYLLDAPTIVKQTAPVAWQYVQAPQDGTLWLEWISPRHEFRFPSDGYVWGDPEQTFQQEFGGYTIEILRHSVGFRPGFDQQVATHARTRYHFRAKSPNIAAPQIDSHLWIVHYHQTDQSHMMSIPSLQIQPVMRQILGERKWLENLGRIERKDFMLHDREHWPQINLPGGGAPPQQGMYPNQMMQQQMNQQRFPQYAYAQGQGPPAKRPRHSGPSGMTGTADGGQDTSIEDEENTSLGDYFDHLTPREISMARYVQHHRWMEEVFSSPYASSQIVPPDLGLGLMGELKGLTEGILEPPSADEVGKGPEKPNQAKDAQPFTNLKKEQVDQFTTRVEKHLEAGRAEIEAMKKAHAEKMAEWKKSKTFMQAEKRLRNATWEGHENAVPAYRLDVPSTNGNAEENAPTETVEDIVKDVERTLGVRIDSHKESNLVEKGGLDEEQQREQPIQPDAMEMNQDTSMMQQQQEPMMSGAYQAEPESLQNYQQPPAPLSQDTSAQITQPPVDVSQPAFDIGQPQPLNNDDLEDQAEEDMDQSALDDMVDMGDMDDMDNMDMDVDASGMDFIENDQTPGDDMAAAAAANVPGMEAGQTTLKQDLSTQAEGNDLVDTAALDPSPIGSPVTLGERGEQEAPVPDQSLPTTSAPLESVTGTATLDTSTTIPPAGAMADLGENEAGLEGTAVTEDVSNVEDVADNSLFDDGTFDDLEGMEGEGGDDGLIDFDGGMGMDDSAFGDAMHGMDTNTPMSGQGDGNPPPV